MHATRVRRPIDCVRISGALSAQAASGGGKSLRVARLRVAFSPGQAVALHGALRGGLHPCAWPQGLIPGQGPPPCVASRAQRRRAGAVRSARPPMFPPAPRFVLCHPGRVLPRRLVALQVSHAALILSLATMCGVMGLRCSSVAARARCLVPHAPLAPLSSPCLCRRGAPRARRP